jgi:gamma-glutamyl-gamma-aminobutyrate hydrolase PuuD
MYAAQLAAAISRWKNISPSVVRLREDAAEGFTETCQHVSPWGAIIPTGLLWVDRIANGSLMPECDECLGSRPGNGTPQVLSLNPRCFSAWNPRRLASAVAARAGKSISVRVETRGQELHATAFIPGGKAVNLPPVLIDRYGRPSPLLVDTLSRDFRAFVGEPGRPTPAYTIAAEPVRRDQGPQSIRIVLIGNERNFRVLGPALLASVGDAAQATGKNVDVEFLSPHDLHRRDAIEIIAAADGLILPGGNDMGEVEGQVTAATEAFRKRVPALGICLGMQSMVVSLTRLLFGVRGANLEELNPHAETLVFRRLRDSDGTPDSRLGAHPVTVNQGTRLASLYRSSEIFVRMAHRYTLNPDLIPILESKGLVIGGQSKDGRVIDAVEFPAHPFFLGIQGHPECSSRSDNPPALVTGFLEAVNRYKRLARKSIDLKLSRH